MIVAPYSPTDRQFVLRGMVQGLCRSRFSADVPSSTAARWAYGSAVRYLSRPSARVTIVKAPGFEAARGFLAAEEIGGLRFTHWVHVEPSWRRQGAATALLDEAHGVGSQGVVLATNETVESRELLKSRNSAYHPFVWWALLDLADPLLADSSKWHRRQFLTVAEHFASE